MKMLAAVILLLSVGTYAQTDTSKDNDTNLGDWGESNCQPWHGLPSWDREWCQTVEGLARIVIDSERRTKVVKDGLPKLIAKLKEVVKDPPALLRGVASMVGDLALHTANILRANIHKIIGGLIKFVNDPLYSLWLECMTTLLFSAYSVTSLIEGIAVAIYKYKHKGANVELDNFVKKTTVIEAEEKLMKYVETTSKNRDQHVLEISWTPIQDIIKKILNFTQKIADTVLAPLEFPGVVTRSVNICKKILPSGLCERMGNAAFEIDKSEKSEADKIEHFWRVVKEWANHHIFIDF